MMNNTKTGLVLEGGAMRGMFTAGVLDVFMENGISFPDCIGVSAGAAFGCNLKSNQPGRILRYNLKYCRDPRFCSFLSLIITGDMFGAQFCYHEIPEKLDLFDTETFKENPMGFYVVASDAETGKPHYQRIDSVDDNCYEWIRASASMPIVSNIVEVEGGKYLDGGITDSIPLRFMEGMHEKNVVVLTRPRDYRKKPISRPWLYRQSLRKYPNLLKAVKKRYLMYNEQRRYVFLREKAEKALVICPEQPLDIGKTEHDGEKIKRVYEIGRQAALQKLDEIKRFIEDDN